MKPRLSGKWLREAKERMIALVSESFKLNDAELRAVLQSAYPAVEPPATREEMLKRCVMWAIDSGIPDYMTSSS